MEALYVFAGVAAVVFGYVAGRVLVRWSIRRCSEDERIGMFAAAVEKAADLYLPEGAVRLSVYQQGDEEEESDTRP